MYKRILIVLVLAISAFTISGTVSTPRASAQVDPCQAFQAAQKFAQALGLVDSIANQGKVFVYNNEFLKDVGVHLYDDWAARGNGIFEKAGNPVRIGDRGSTIKQLEVAGWKAGKKQDSGQWFDKNETFKSPCPPPPPGANAQNPPSPAPASNALPDSATNLAVALAALVAGVFLFPPTAQALARVRF